MDTVADFGSDFKGFLNALVCDIGGPFVDFTLVRVPVETEDVEGVVGDDSYQRAGC